MTEEVRAEVLRLHREGNGVLKIGRLTGLNRRQVARVLAHEGITRKANTSASTRLDEIKALKAKGVSNAEIGRRLGFSRKAVAKALGKG